ncbi:MAG: fibronectin type III domain-containing protein [Deltaproteobacteria bacterium]|nr:fibronectin type III domain-containing protein [Deltaproteobacteria bacterium]
MLNNNCFRVVLLCFLLVVPFSVNAAQVKLKWDANNEDDLAGYKLYYKTGLSGEPYNGAGADQGASPLIVPLASLSDVNNPEFTLTGLSDNEVYYFAITAYDTEGLESGYSNEVDGLVISLDQGPNLISFYRQPADTDITSVLSSISNKYSRVTAFINNSWKIFIPEYPELSTLNTMETGIGYFVDMNEPATLLMYGQAASNTVNLENGPNMTGYNIPDSHNMADALNSIKGKYVSVKTIVDGNWKVYYPDNPALSDLTDMEPGQGYWIETIESCNWSLP